MLKKERNYEFRQRMLCVHKKNVYDLKLRAKEDEFEIEVLSEKKKRSTDPYSFA